LQDHNLLHAWKLADENEPVIKLMTLLFSFGCNAADMEQFWSITRSIKTKLRNHMKLETLQWVAVVKLGI